MNLRVVTFSVSGVRNKAFALAGVGAPLSLHQYVKKMSCLRAGLPKAWKTTSDHRGSAKNRDSVRSASVNCENYTLVLEMGSSI